MSSFELDAWRCTARYLTDRSGDSYEAAVDALVADYNAWYNKPPIDPPDPPDPPHTIIAGPDNFRQQLTLLQPGDTLQLLPGTYVSGSTAQAPPVMNVEVSGTEDNWITIVGGDGVVFEGSRTTRVLVHINASYVVLRGIAFADGRRSAIQIEEGSHDIQVVDCSAQGIKWDDRHIGAAFRTVGPVQRIDFIDCRAWDSNGGFQCRESTSTTGADKTPPIRLETRAQWMAWSVAGGAAMEYGGATDVTLQNCVAHNCRTRGAHSDGFGFRYTHNLTLIDCVAFECADEGFDLLGCSVTSFQRCIGYSNGGLGTDGVKGNGNGFKVGARGGYDCSFTNCLAFDNERGGFELADCEIVAMVNCTADDAGGRWFGVFSEAARGNGVGLTLSHCLLSRHDKGDAGFIAGVIPELDMVTVNDNNHQWARHPVTIIGRDELPYDLDFEIREPVDSPDSAQYLISDCKGRYASPLGFVG